ncbi:hypothetical protein J2X11_000300 [Aeromicrobium panaciterrae]|uniref:Fibronectin type-III domain-containing protein n=1 Tax=Aeromicrobium panaciterrae TaxID=363861 RepID=A0ABU1UJW3_9ACTN|nr:fibronectin type III domain-containing protein [Aeromicrobium panaciterrae]MDR7085461.1 hypothetical protein [Aeromicrobium panaciterrae]
MSAFPARSRLRALALAVVLVAIAPVLVSSPAAAILQTITNTSPPTVTVAAGGVPEVGSTVTASPGTWNPSSGVTFAYQWLADGADIANATAASLPVTSALLGKKLSVRVTGSGFLDTPGTATSAQTAAVDNPTVRNLTLPTLTGTFKIDNTVGSSTGTWSPSGSTYARQWFADGVAIAGATATTYKLTAAEVGKQISVRVTAAKAGYVTGAATSALSTAVQPGVITNLGVPTIYGTLKVGQTIGANPGSWSPLPTAYSYRWFANGTLIPGVTTKTFVPDQTLYGKTLKVEVTGTKTGYTSAASQSATSAALGCSVSVPTGLTSSSVTTSKIRVNWTKAFCATKYVVSYRLANATEKTNVVVGDVSTYLLTGLLRARSYRIWVAAISADGVQSAFTPSILVKTAS